MDDLSGAACSLRSEFRELPLSVQEVSNDEESEISDDEEGMEIGGERRFSYIALLWPRSTLSGC